MSHAHDPWRRDERPPSGSGGRFLLWLALMAAAGFALWKLSETYPGAIRTDFDSVSLFSMGAVFAAVSLSFVLSGSARAREHLRNLGIWTSVAAALVLGYSFREELGQVWQRVRSELIPGEPVVTSAQEVVLSRSPDGHFYVFGEANGTRIRFLIDTGASDTVLSPSDAQRIGIDPKGLNYSQSYETANGVGFGARYTLALLVIGPIEVTDMPISVNRADMGSSLLGMSFLQQLSSFEVRGDRLFLRWR